MWNAFIYAWTKPHTSQFHLFVASLEKHLKVLRLLLLNFASQIFFWIQIPREGFLFTNVESEKQNHWEWEKCGDWSRKLIPLLSGNLHDQDLSNKLPFQSNRKQRVWEFREAIHRKDKFSWEVDWQTPLVVRFQPLGRKMVGLFKDQPSNQAFLTLPFEPTIYLYWIILWKNRRWSRSCLLLVLSVLCVLI